MLILTLLASIVAGCADNSADSGLTDGTYESEAKGNNGPVKVSMKVKKGKILSIKVVEHSETEGLSDPAIENIPKAIVDGQTLAVDTVSGATVTSNAILDAVADCIKQAGGNPDDFKAVADKDTTGGKTISMDTDVLVIGGGGGGLAAAVKAAQSGKKVLLLEKMPSLGGVTILNAGTLIATDSRFQKEVLGEKNDSPELAYKDIMKVGKNVNDPTLVKMVTEKVGSVVDWLVDDLKVQYDVAATQYPDHSADRQIGVVGRSPAWIETMSDKFTEMGGTIMTETRATELMTENGAVTGAKATDADGNTLEIAAKSVVIATGGFGADTEMLPDSLKGYLFYGIDSETGDGLKMATAIGADTTNMDCVKVYPQGVEIVPTRGLAATASSTATCNGHGAIYVNSKGKRIVNENATLGELTEITVAQDDKIMYLVMDDEAWKTYVAKSLEDKLVGSEEELNDWLKVSNDDKPVLVVNDDVKKAASDIGIDGDALAKTIEHYNKMCKAGKDTDFGKKDPVAIGKGPYHIVEQKPRFQTTLGGLKANEKLAILDKDGNEIPNLFGAGCVVGGANGKDSMTAMMNSWAIVSGAVAGESAVKNIK